MTTTATGSGVPASRKARRQNGLRWKPPLLPESSGVAVTLNAGMPEVTGSGPSFRLKELPQLGLRETGKPERAASTEASPWRRC